MAWSHDPGVIGARVEDLDTPSLLLDLDKVELIPSHCDTTINLHDEYYVTREGRVVAVWPIATRGRVR